MRSIKSIFLYFSIEFSSWNSLVAEFFCQVNSDLTVWIDGARPYNTCIPPSFPANTLAQPRCILTPKIDLHGFKKLAKFNEISFFYFKNQRNILKNSLWAAMRSSSVDFEVTKFVKPPTRIFLDDIRQQPILIIQHQSCAERENHYWKLNSTFLCNTNNIINEKIK